MVEYVCMWYLGQRPQTVCMRHSKGGKEATQQWLKAKISVQGLPLRDLYTRLLYIEDAQDLRGRSQCLNAEALSTRSLYLKSLYKIFVRHLYARVGKISARDRCAKVSWQDLCTSSLPDMSYQDLCEISV